MNARDQRRGQCPDIRVAIDESITYALVVGDVHGMTTRLILRVTTTGDVLASIERTMRRPEAA